jgi:hypothetical protein
MQNSVQANLLEKHELPFFTDFCQINAWQSSGCDVIITVNYINMASNTADSDAVARSNTSNH